MGFVCRPLKKKEWKDAMALAWHVFLKFNAPDYTDEGIENFREFVTDKTLEKMFRKGVYRAFGAFYKDDIIGMITVRDGNHISLLFVDEDYQKKGVGAALLEEVESVLLTEGTAISMTVFAAPGAEKFYHKCGFIDTALQKTTDGITYTPMEKYLW